MRIGGAHLNNPRASQLHCDNRPGGHPHLFERSPRDIAIIKAGDHNAIVLQPRQRRGVKDRVVEKAPSGSFRVRDTNELKVNFRAQR